MKSFNKIWKHFLSDEDAALDQWISVLVLAILAIIIFLALRRPVIFMLNGVINKTGQQMNMMVYNQNCGCYDFPT